MKNIRKAWKVNIKSYEAEFINFLLFNWTADEVDNSKSEIRELPVP